ASYSGWKHDLAAPGAFKCAPLRTLVLSFACKLMRLLKDNVSSTLGVPRLRGSDRNPPKGGTPNQAAALIIVLAFMVLLTGLALAYFSHTASDRQLAQASFHDASADLLARNALDIIVSSLKREITVAGVNVSQANVQPQRSGCDASIPSLIRCSVRNDAISPPSV